VTKVLIVNQPGSNRGDEAASRGMLYGLKQFIPNAQFTVLTTVPPLCLDGVENVRLLENLPLRGLRGWQAIRRIIRYLAGYYLDQTCTPHMAEVFAAYKQADLIISAPAGPYIGELYRWWELEMLFHIWLGTLTSSPVMIYAPSMGPFQVERRNRWRKRILERVELITVREPISAGYLSKLQVQRPAQYITIDSVLQRPVDSELGETVFAQQGLKRNKTYIGFSPSLPLSKFQSDEKKMQFIELLVQTLRLLVDRFDPDLVFFPHGYGAWRDRPFIESLVSTAGIQGQAHILPESLTSDEQQALAGQMSAFVSFRYHPGMFALRQGVPCVIVAYQHKIRGFMEALGMEQFCLDLESVSACQLGETLADACKKRAIIEQQLRPKFELLERTSLKNSFFASLLLKYRSQQRSTALNEFIDEQLQYVEWSKH